MQEDVGLRAGCFLQRPLERDFSCNKKYMAKRCKKMWVYGLDVFCNGSWNGTILAIKKIWRKDARRCGFTGWMFFATAAGTALFLQQKKYGEKMQEDVGLRAGCFLKRPLERHFSCNKKYMRKRCKNLYVCGLV